MDPAILTATTARVCYLITKYFTIYFTTTQPFLWLFSYNSYITFIYYYMFLCDVVMCGCRLPEVMLPWRWQGRGCFGVRWWCTIGQGGGSADPEQEPLCLTTTIRTHYTTLPHHILRNTATQYDQYKHLIKVYLIIFMSNTHIVHTGSISQLLTIATSVNREETNLLQHNVHRPPLT